MAGAYPPTLTVAGRRIASSAADFSAVMALDELEFEWGADNLLDELPPAVMRATLIDPDGYWSTSADLIGQAVTVQRVQHPSTAQPSDYQFRGRVTDATIEPRRIRHPVSGDNVLVWMVKLTAADKLAELAKLIPAPPVKKTSWWEPGDHYNPTDKTNERRDALLAAAAGVVAGMDTYNPSNWGNTWGMAPYSDLDQLDVLTHLQRMYRGEALSRAAYDAGNDWVRRVPCAIISAGLALTYTAGRVGIAGADPTIYTLPAKALGMLSDRALSANDATAIDVVELNFWNWTTVYKPDDSSTPRVSAVWHEPETPVTALTSHASKGKGSRRLVVDTPYLGDSINGYTPFTNPILQEYINRLGDLNDKWYLPPLRIDLDRYEPADVSVLDACLRTRPSIGMSMAMPGSLYAGLERMVPAYQLIAGNLRWTREDSDTPRWVLDGRWAPVAAGSNVTSAVRTLAQLSTNTSARLSDFDPTITLADLRHVTTGLT